MLAHPSLHPAYVLARLDDAPSQWLANELSALLSTPQVQPPSQFIQVKVEENDKPEYDLFTTRFNDVFIRHARGLVGGREVDREGLKRTLLALQKQWSASGCTFGVCELHYGIEGFHVGLFVKPAMQHQKMLNNGRE